MAMVASGAWGDGNGNDDGDYLVRAYFDNAGFVVTGEEVRIAGALGSVQEVRVSRPGEAVTEDGSEDPGKAVIVLKIDDGGFQNFLTDASCLIRPQSLLGEKYVDCEPTMPRAPEASRRRRWSRSPTATSAPGNTACRSRTTASRSISI